MSKPDPTGESLESILASIRRSLSEQSTDVLEEEAACRAGRRAERRHLRADAAACGERGATPPLLVEGSAALLEEAALAEPRPVEPLPRPRACHQDPPPSAPAVGCRRRRPPRRVRSRRRMRCGSWAGAAARQRRRASRPHPSSAPRPADVDPKPAQSRTRAVRGRARAAAAVLRIERRGPEGRGRAGAAERGRHGHDAAAGAAAGEGPSNGQAAGPVAGAGRPTACATARPARSSATSPRTPGPRRRAPRLTCMRWRPWSRSCCGRC